MHWPAVVSCGRKNNGMNCSKAEANALLPFLWTEARAIKNCFVQNNKRNELKRYIYINLVYL